MKLVYNGAHPDVYIPDPEGGDALLEGVERGVPIEVPDDLAERLLEQSTWAEVSAFSPPRVSPPAPTVAARPIASTDGVNANTGSNA